MNALLGSAYAGNINYFSCIKKADKIAIECYEHFTKQSYRNRCEVYGANGKLNLIIPIIRKKGKNPVREIKIDYSSNWQKIHWKSLQSSYRSSAYFEYYEHQFHKLYNHDKPGFLVDFNMELTSLIIKALDLDVSIDQTTSYQKNIDGFIDYRNSIHHKLPPTDHYKEQGYFQVFNDKFGFLSNLSIYDLLFNMGPESVLYL